MAESPSLMSPPQRDRAEIVEETEPNGASLPCPCTIRILDCSRAAASFDSLLDMITTCDFRFVCPVKWDTMADLPDGSGKHCDHCQRPVVTVHTRKEFNAAAKRGDCVAVFPEGEEELPRLSGEPLLPESFRLMGDPAPDWPLGQSKAPKKQGRKGEVNGLA